MKQPTSFDVDGSSFGKESDHNSKQRLNSGDSEPERNALNPHQL